MDNEHREVSIKLIKITLLSLVFMGVELVGGYLANSVSIFADAFHLLSDVLAYLISLGAVWLSTRPSSPAYLTFGWEKAEPLGALINIAVIYLVTGELFVEATKRMINQEVVEEPKYMLITSIFGLLCNIVIMGILHNDPHGGHHGCSHGHSHSHQTASCSHNHSHQTVSCSHDHSHQIATCSHLHSHQGCSSINECNSPHDALHSHEKLQKEEDERNSGDQLGGKQSEISMEGEDVCKEVSLPSKEDLGEAPVRNINLEAAYIHILTDIILSVGVIISALIIYFMSPDHHSWSPWHLADPLCTYLFSFLAIYSTWPILKESALLLLSASHQPNLPHDIRHQIEHLPSVLGIDTLRVWSTNREKHYVAVKVKVEAGCNGEEVKRILKERGVESFVEVRSED